MEGAKGDKAALRRPIVRDTRSRIPLLWGFRRFFGFNKGRETMGEMGIMGAMGGDAPKTIKPQTTKADRKATGSGRIRELFAIYFDGYSPSVISETDSRSGLSGSLSSIPITNRL